MEGLLSMGPTLSSLNAEEIYSCIIGSKLTAVLPDQAVLAKHKCLFWQTRLLCIVVELAGQGSAISRATPSSSINYPVPPSSIPSMSVWSKKSISMKAGLFTMAFASKEAMVVLLPSPIKKMTKNKTANV